MLCKFLSLWLSMLSHDQHLFSYHSLLNSTDNPQFIQNESIILHHDKSNDEFPSWLSDWFNPSIWNHPETRPTVQPHRSIVQIKEFWRVFEHHICMRWIVWANRLCSETFQISLKQLFSWHYFVWNLYISLG